MRKKNHSPLLIVLAWLLINCVVQSDLQACEDPIIGPLIRREWKDSSGWWAEQTDDSLIVYESEILPRFLITWNQVMPPKYLEALRENFGLPLFWYCRSCERYFWIYTGKNQTREAVRFEAGHLVLRVYVIPPNYHAHCDRANNTRGPGHCAPFKEIILDRNTGKILQNWDQAPVQNLCEKPLNTDFSH